ncbi:hypothetical protein MUK42_30843 [Musa troglodytarum]|uniref:Uncharacterized protein n=1 Tax=Musa troglodytarum TaxID=320322 RepID=A0A9E7JXB3_9LILI|nr:hypothetical protein MUK42_30843 [Musa troglodytarum]
MSPLVFDTALPQRRVAASQLGVPGGLAWWEAEKKLWFWSSGNFAYAEAEKKYLTKTPGTWDLYRSFVGEERRDESGGGCSPFSPRCSSHFGERHGIRCTTAKAQLFLQELAERTHRTSILMCNVEQQRPTPLLRRHRPPSSPHLLVSLPSLPRAAPSPLFSLPQPPPPP